MKLINVLNRIVIVFVLLTGIEGCFYTNLKYINFAQTLNSLRKNDIKNLKEISFYKTGL